MYTTVRIPITGRYKSFEPPNIVSCDFFQVKPSSTFDPCISSAEAISNELQNVVLGDDSKLVVFLRKGEIGKAAQVALSVLKAFNNEDSDCGQALGQDVKTLVGACSAK